MTIERHGSLVEQLLAAMARGDFGQVHEYAEQFVVDDEVDEIDRGVLIRFDDDSLDLDDPCREIDVLEGHVSPSRFESLQDGATLTAREHRIWLEATADSIFNVENALWRLIRIEDETAAQAILAVVMPPTYSGGDLPEIVGVFGSEPEARAALSREGYLDPEDLRRRFPFTPLPEPKRSPRRKDATVDDSVLAAIGYTAAHDHFRVCRKCGRLYEEGRPDGLDQRCWCPHPPSERWPGHDVQERARLCGCCGVAVLPSGSRWSPFFCGDCQTYAMAATMFAGRLVFPIGRHSLMHTWVPNTRTPTLAAHGGNGEALAATVLAAIDSISGGTAMMEDWAGRLAKENLRRLKLPHGTPLRDYLAALIADRDVGVTNRLQAFGRFCAFAREWRPGDAPPRRGK